jgi:phosphoribosyl 1,2-cyclic phosphodiesterase
MTGNDKISIRFWGVRGSIASPGPETLRYGGNTSCLEVNCGDDLLILDCGTGARRLGLKILGEGRREADLLFSHSHIDHVAGLPFFQPAQDPGFTLRIWGGHHGAGGDLRSVLAAMMTAPLFPIPLDALCGNISFHDFDDGARFEPRPGIAVATAPLNHPNGSVGYRITFGGKSVCYITDTEHLPDHPDQNILGLVEGADLMIYDATYTDEEFERFKGWGHSTWQEGARLADAAEVGTYVAFHHDPSHDDDRMDEIAAELERFRPGSVVAREGMILEP